jgi:hypothetical protein
MYIKTSVVVRTPIDTPGVHFWRIKKILAGASGSKARVGVLVRDCEMDMDYEGAHFENRCVCVCVCVIVCGWVGGCEMMRAHCLFKCVCDIHSQTSTHCHQPAEPLYMYVCVCLCVCVCVLYIWYVYIHRH